MPKIFSDKVLTSAGQVLRAAGGLPSEARRTGRLILWRVTAEWGSSAGRTRQR